MPSPDGIDYDPRMRPVEPPASVAPAPPVRELPAPVPLRRMLGPSVILAGLAVGSGEFVLWPHLTVKHGFDLFWACWIGVTIQFFINMEIERYTLATGESAVTGFFRLHRGFGPVFLACATLPWIWPGWATGAARIVTWETGVGDGAVVPIAIAGLVGCGAALSLGPVVYRTVETIQMVLVATIFVVVVILAFLVVDADSIGALLAGASRVGHVPEDVALPTLLGALAFAGAGGALNLAQSNYIRDKGYGMGGLVGRITSPLTGKAESESVFGAVFAGSPQDLSRWRTWWRRANAEHALSFFALCLISLVLFCLVAHALLGVRPDAPNDLGFVREQGVEFAHRFGDWARHVYLIGGILVLFSTEFALLDAVSRVAADSLGASFLSRSSTWTPSRTYFAVLWSLIAFGVIVLLVGFDQPLALLILAASLNGGVMFLYSGTLLWLNLRTFKGPLRPSLLRASALGAACAFFGWFTYLTLVDRLS